MGQYLHCTHMTETLKTRNTGNNEERHEKTPTNAGFSERQQEEKGSQKTGITEKKLKMQGKKSDERREKY